MSVPEPNLTSNDAYSACLIDEAELCCTSTMLYYLFFDSLH